MVNLIAVTTVLLVNEDCEPRLCFKLASRAAGSISVNLPRHSDTTFRVPSSGHSQWLNNMVLEQNFQRVFGDDQGIIFLISPLNVYCGYSLELLQQGDSNEYPQRMILWRTDENYPLIIIKYPSYLFHWFQESLDFNTFQILWILSSCFYNRNNTSLFQQVCIT